MNSFNFCPHCRSANVEFAHHQRFTCFDCGMVFYQNVAAAVVVILEKEGRILFTVRNKAPQKHLLALPGGFTDPDETAEESCARELKEELNINIAPEKFTYFTSQPNNYTFKNFPYKTEDLIFTAKLPENIDIKLQKDEIKAIKWIDKGHINFDEIAFISLKKALREYIEK